MMVLFLSSLIISLVAKRIFLEIVTENGILFTYMQCCYVLLGEFHPSSSPGDCMLLIAFLDINYVPEDSNFAICP
jgi:hypothetical protein